MKGLLAVGVILLGASSPAVFDLQRVDRFSSSGIVTSGFSHVAPKAGGGFYAAGTAGNDVLIAEFDAFGGLVRTQIWDSPLVLADFPQFLGVLANGRVIIGVANAPGGDFFLAQFSPTLVPLWEVKRVGGTRAALDGSGNAYIASNTDLASYSSVGAFKGAVSVSGFEMNDLIGFPGTSFAGVVLAGRDSTGQPRAIRFDDTCTTIYSKVDTTFVAASGSRYVSVDAESTGGVVLGGCTGSSGNTGSIFSRISNVGTLATFGIVGGAQLSYVKIRDATSVHAVLDTVNDKLVRITRTSGEVTEQTAADAEGIAYHTELPGSQKIVYTTLSEARIRSVNSTTLGSPLNFTAPFFQALAPLSTDLAVGVGSPDGVMASVTFTDGVSSPSTSAYQFAGGALRTLLNSVSLPDGSVAMICQEQAPSGLKLLALRYRTNGTLVYAKSIAFGAQSIVSNKGPLVGFADGSIAYAQRLGSNTWGFARVSNTGAVFSNVFPGVDSEVRPGRLVALPDGSTAVFSEAATENLRYTRVSATATMVQQHTYTDHTGYSYLDIAPPVVLNNGNIVVAAQTTLGTIKFRAINPNTGAAGTTFTFGTVCNAVRLDTDAAGNLVLAYDDGGIMKLERRSGSNLATLLTGASVGTVQEIKDVEVSANGNILVLVRQVGDDQLKYFTSNFASLPSATFITGFTPSDLAVDSTNVAYVTGEEVVGDLSNVYSARYLANAVRSAQRRTAAKAPGQVFVAGGGVWITGNVGTRKKGEGPFAARYSL